MVVTLIGVALIGILMIVGADIHGEFNHIRDRLLEVL